MASSLLLPGVEGGGGCSAGGGALLLLHIASLCVTSGVSANNVTDAVTETTTTTTQSSVAETTGATTTTAAAANGDDPTTSTAGAPTTGAATAAPAATDAPAPPVTTTADPEAGMFDCFYCGVEDPCDQPFVENFVGRINKTKIIKCEVSCFKFDGYASDGKRILMRDCGYFDTDECVSGQNFEDGTAVGTICHCKGNVCNGATKTAGSIFLGTTAAIAVWRLINMR